MMSKFNNMKIAAKLIIGFVIVAMMAGIVGGVGIYYSRAINNADTQLYSDNTMGISEVSTIAISYQRVRYNMLKILLDSSTKEASQEKITGFRTTIEETLPLYESAVFSEEDRVNYNALKDAWKDYSGDIDQILDYVNNNQMDSAMEFAFGDAAAAGDKMQTAVDTLIEFNENEAHEKSVSNDKLASKALYIMVITVLLCVILAIAFGIIIARNISGPVQKMKMVAVQLAQGDVEVDIDITSKDEIGELADAMRTMIANTQAQAKAAERISEGDLTVNIEVRSEKDLLGQKLYELVEKNNETLSSIATAADQVSMGASQVSNSSMALSQGATEQASSVQQLTASLEEISAQTKINAQNATQANELAEVAKNTAVHGNTQMKEMQNAMNDINSSSANISKIIKVIDEIAFQTNILALNAAVEAARAGQHGKGFAVVAEEVRNLAARSANAAKETTDLIEGSIQKVEAGTKIANNTAEALNKIVDDVAKAATLVADIATASNEQAIGISQINQGIMQVSQVVQTNSATAEESAAASEELSSQAELLKESVGKYKLKTGKNVSDRYRHLNPEVIRLLEDMDVQSKRGIKNTNVNSNIGSLGKQRILLNDSEFGKY